MKFMKTLISGASAFAGLFAAFLWWKASIVVVPPSEQLDADGFIGGQITVELPEVGEIDPFATAAEQSKWNKYAAQASALAAFLQAVVWMMPE
jgi:hypothetical protein